MERGREVDGFGLALASGGFRGGLGRAIAAADAGNEGWDGMVGVVAGVVVACGWVLVIGRRNSVARGRYRKNATMTGVITVWLQVQEISGSERGERARNRAPALKEDSGPLLLIDWDCRNWTRRPPRPR